MKLSAPLLALPLALAACLGWLVASGQLTLVLAQNKSAPAKSDGTVLPFPTTPSASVAGATLQESTMKWRKEPDRLKPGAPNVLIVLIDDDYEVVV